MAAPLSLVIGSLRNGCMRMLVVVPSGRAVLRVASVAAALSLVVVACVGVTLSLVIDAIRDQRMRMPVPSGRGRRNSGDEQEAHARPN